MKSHIMIGLAWSLLVIAAMAGITLYAGGLLPEGDRIPLHFGPDGQPDRFGDRAEALTLLWLLPGIMAGVSLILAIAPLLDPRRDNVRIGRRAYLAVWVAVSTVMLFVHAGTAYAMVNSTSPSFETTGIDRSNGNTAGFAELQTTPFAGAALVANIRHDANDQFGGATTFRVAPSYIVPGTGTRLKGSVGTGFKPPTLSQLYQDYPGFRFFGNPNLRPEESFGFDGGFEQPLFDGFMTVGATYYQTDFKNLIQTAYYPTFSTNVNVGQATGYGTESFVALRLNEFWSGRLDWTTTVTKDEIAHQELLRRPRNKVSATAIWNLMPGLTMTGSLIVLGSFVDGNRDFSVPRLKAPGFTLVNLSVNYAWSETLTVFGRIDNLFDQRYQNPTGFQGPGLAVYGGVRVTSF